MRAIARRAATIFQPPMLPERSSTSTTSRGRELAAQSTTRAGGTIVSAKVPSTLVGVGMKRQRRPHAITPEPEPEDEIAVQPLAWLKDQSGALPVLFPPDREQADAQVIAAAAVSYRSIVSESRTGLGKPGSKTGGEIREASGTALVSTAVPSPTDGPLRGTPGI